MASVDIMTVNISNILEIPKLKIFSFSEHYDFDTTDRPFNDDNGNRIASVLFYVGKI